MHRMFVGMFITLLALSFSMQGCAKKKKGMESLGSGMMGEDLQGAALRGDDIPLMEQPELGSFVEPNDPLVFADVYFDYDKSELRSDARPTLENISRWLRDHSGVQLMIEGHCDERGSNEYNLALGEQRALAIRRYLVGLDTEADRLHTVSYGEERPADPSHSEEAWSKNRRAHFLVSAE